jgi:hypothetical protein
MDNLSRWAYIHDKRSVPWIVGGIRVPELLKSRSWGCAKLEVEAEVAADTADASRV